MFFDIANEAHARMERGWMSDGKRPRRGGGWTITYDPTRACFKQALIAVVFTGVWLEATLHQAMVAKLGIKKAEANDRNTYEQKLAILGIQDSEMVTGAERLSTRPGRKSSMRKPSCRLRGY